MASEGCRRGCGRVVVMTTAAAHPHLRSRNGASRTAGRATPGPTRHPRGARLGREATAHPTLRSRTDNGDMTVPQAADAARRARISARVMFLVVVGALLAVVAFAVHSTVEVYEAVAAGDGIETLDQPVLRAAIDVRSPGLTDLAVTLTALAGRIGTPVLGLVALGLFTWRRRDWTPTVLLVTGLLGSLCLTVLGKRLTDRARPPRQFMLPPYETSPSFPSGHTLNTTVLAVIVGYLVLITARHLLARWAVVGVCTVGPMGVGMSRIYLGAHWSTDVIAGLLVGSAWAFSVVLAHRVWLQVRRRERLDASAGTTPELDGGGATAAPVVPST